MPRLPSWILPVTGLVLVFGIALSRSDLDSANGPAQQAAVSNIESGSEPSAADRPWPAPQDADRPDSRPHTHLGSERHWQEHWTKHREEFPEYGSEQEYERAARDFAQRPPPGTLTKHRHNGDTLLYDPQSDTFAVEDRNGRPRTYFRPRGGQKYWDRQGDE